MILSYPLVALLVLAAQATKPASRLAAAEPAIVPRPVEIEPGAGRFRLGEKSAVLVQSPYPEAKSVAEQLAAWLRTRTGLPLPVREKARDENSAGSIVLATAGGHSRASDHYDLTISERGVGIFAAHPQGLFYAFQTLRQLLPPECERTAAVQPPNELEWPCLRISDHSRFLWRGMLLDCGRHFMDKEFVKRTIDLLAYHKLNVLHWHLTEDQGWRIEIKKFPKLTEVGAWRRATRDSEQPRDAQGRYGGFYTQDDIREIVAYAKSRYVTIVPEIEMPGHCLAALAAYPELSCTGGPFEVRTEWGVEENVYCAGNEKTFEFLESVLAEVIDLFPGQYIHIGGDEVPKARWNSCPKCQERIQAEGLKDERELQSYFVRRIEKFLASRNRRLIGWDEILEGGLAPNATVQSWRGMAGAVAAASAGHDVIASPTSHCYLDYPQRPDPAAPGWMGFIDLEKAYSFDPLPAALPAAKSKHIQGVEGNIWTERAPQPRVDWQVFPRLAALAEVGWSPASMRDFADFSRRMRTHYRRLDALGVEYFVPLPQLASDITSFQDSCTLEFKPLPVDGRIHFTLDGSEPTAASPVYARAIRLDDSAEMRARTILASGRVGDEIRHRIRKLRPLDSVQLAVVQPGLAYELYNGSWRMLPEFDKLTPLRTGVAAVPEDALAEARSVAQGGFALRLRGSLSAPADGVYTITLRSDDGARVLLHDEEIVNHDGLHAVSDRRGEVLLRAGWHPLTIEYFDAGGASALAVEIEGPLLQRQPLTPGMLGHAP
ncbi:MAG: family 20 glycosylhydrolase [Phycisphaerae bacterium]|jgi:hexosaminidase